MAAILSRPQCVKVAMSVQCYTRPRQPLPNGPFRLLMAMRPVKTVTPHE